jgi:serine protease Do
MVGSDPKTDLAVIHISGKEPFPHVAFGDSDKLEVGEWVVAIGHPRGLDQTVTQGIISAKHRRGITDPSSYQDFLQTDAAINPGNSGGPLLTLKGEVVGVNAAIASESGGFEGIGFTIPSNIAVHVAQAILAHGKVERGWLGVTMRDATPETGKSTPTSTEKGALIVEVLKNGPADKAGLKKDDVILEYNDRAVRDSGMLRNEVANTPVGREVKVIVLRKGQRLPVTVKIGNLESATKIYLAVVKEKIGAEVRSLTSQEESHFGLEAGRGVIITRLENRGPLKEAGFELGDIILAVDQQPVEGVDGFVQMMEALKPKVKVTLVALDHRSGNVGTVVIGPIP